MWRPWGDDESMELVDINVIDEEIINLNDDGESNRVDRNELEEEGASSSNLSSSTQTKKFLSEDAKILVQTLFKNLLKKEFKAPLTLTPDFLELPVSTVHRIINQEKEDLKRKKYSRASIYDSFTENEIDEIKNTVYEIYRENNVPTTEAIKKRLLEKQFPFNYSEETLRRILQRIGFSYKKINKRLSIMESKHLKVQRTEFISKIRKYRQEGRNIVYLDETWYDTHDTINKGWIDNSGNCQLKTPPSRGKRLIILHAGSKNGWVRGSLLLSARNIANCSADYHQDMDAKLFEEWFENQLLPNVDPNSVIVMDNAPYHSRQIDKVPNMRSVKSKIINFMESHGLDVPEKTKKTDLIKIISESNIDKTKKYAVDTLAQTKGHTVLRLPPYYCVLNPIELVWSNLKHNVRKSNRTPNLAASVVDIVRRKVDKIDNVLWENCIRHVINVEDSYVSDRDFPEFIINLNDDSSTDSDASDIDL